MQAYKLLYKNEEEYYNYGQVVTHNEIVFEKLNPLTNKIKITLLSELGGVRFLEDAPEIVPREKMLENVSWERTVTRGSMQKGDFILSEFNRLPEYADKPPAQCLLEASVPKAGATGFVLALHPITSNNALTTSNSTYFVGVRRLGYNQPVHTPEASVLTIDKPYREKLIADVDKLKVFKLSLMVDRDPAIKQKPSWAPTASATVPGLDYTTTWTAEIQTYKKNIFASEYTKTTEFFNSSNRDLSVPFGEDYNQFDFDNDIRLNDGSSKVEGFAFGERNVNVQGISPEAKTQKIDFTTYPESVLVKPSNFSNNGPRLTEWADPDMQAYWRYAADNPRTKYSTYYKTFKVEFDLYHANTDNSIDLVGTSTKYLIANKKINLYFKDFLTANQALQKDFASDKFTDDRRVFVVARSFTQVYKLPIRRQDNQNGIRPAGTVDSTGPDSLYNIFQSLRTDTPSTGLTDFLFYTNSTQQDVLIYEYEVIHNKTKSVI